MSEQLKEYGPEIYKDCVWYTVKHFSVGDVEYCGLYDEELILDANDCVSSECEHYKKRGT